MTTHKKIQFSLEEHVAKIVLAAPPVNCIGDDLLCDLECLLETLQGADIRAVVIASAFPDIFCAGADIHNFPNWDEAMGTRMSARGNLLFDRIAALPVPVICAITGGAYGGGVELALACDIRVADRSARLALPESGLGIIPAYGAARRLPKLIGRGRAGLMLYAGKVVTGKTAVDWGLCDELADDGKAVERAMDIAMCIAAKAPLAVRNIKTLLSGDEVNPPRDELPPENIFFGQLCETEDKKEGVQAFLQKRRAQFSGR